MKKIMDALLDRPDPSVLLVGMKCEAFCSSAELSDAVGAIMYYGKYTKFPIVVKRSEIEASPACLFCGSRMLFATEPVR